MARTGTTHNASYGTVAVGATAVLVVSGSQRYSVVVQNVHASQVLYLGDDSSVATTTGIRLNPGEAFTFEAYTGPIYGIASGAATDVRYFVEG